uniref:Uncharacterized protein n=1 Tax=Craspedostauros australis TaxID=1486917 RepID=A0A7R9WQC8_9STRA|mmetsp:Transcript_15908/g.43971  ORF Transcript_15908/g.43971 Transcript_15908/m.43971 type:complete len:285 (+) Transcript_15908:75-929(+)|eukprot:CAMPEP_0198108870 /NCGR_PEP_ID=MMETSP1442-20131203/905_1 /TAXON_ID= /ORGANISM="Craspedostauros australis, Strain CCMP3328" /LENGTH=284 /DNA_ID=CAMNT_0043764269 /DNA_START=58 /DNA_END=912 /DNA_ORIENTATION=+
MTSNIAQKPRDGPAMAFIPEPVVGDMIRRSTDYYGIVVNAMWPPPDDLLEPYHKDFLPRIRGCFDDADLPIHDHSNNDAPVYLYPGAYLHVTIATLYPIVKQEAIKTIEGGSSSSSGSSADEKNNDGESPDQLQQTIAKHKAQWQNVLQLASQHPDWPTQALQFEIDSAQIGSKAGILLWKETTGGVQKMRDCLVATVATHASDLRIHSIPNIVHSTFLRFQSVPLSEGAVVQERFKADVLPKLKDIFPKPITAKWIKMACEWTPYMHIPDDDHHVYSTVHLEK